jgi:hypothetical protein
MSNNWRIGPDHHLEYYDPDFGDHPRPQRGYIKKPNWWKIGWLNFANRKAAEDYVEIHGWPEVTA